MLTSLSHAQTGSTQEDVIRKQIFSESAIIKPYRANYVLPAYYTQSPDQAICEQRNPNEEGIRHTDIKFQISIKARLINGMLDKQDGLFFAYTQQSY